MRFLDSRIRYLLWFIKRTQRVSCLPWSSKLSVRCLTSLLNFWARSRTIKVAHSRGNLAIVLVTQIPGLYHRVVQWCPPSCSFQLSIFYHFSCLPLAFHQTPHLSLLNPKSITNASNYGFLWNLRSKRLKWLKIDSWEIILLNTFFKCRFSLSP